MGGTIAAGLAIATTGIYMSHSLKLDSDVSSGQVVLINTEEPVDNEEVKNNVKVKKEKAQNQQKVADSKKVKVNLHSQMVPTQGITWLFSCPDNIPNNINPRQERR